jgi:RNA recognition motif-containing protein
MKTSLTNLASTAPSRLVIPRSHLSSLWSFFHFCPPVNMPMDRRTGFIKGYAFVEYQTKQVCFLCLVHWIFTLNKLLGGSSCHWKRQWVCLFELLSPYQLLINYCRFELLGNTISVDWAFSQGPSRRRTTTRRREWVFFGLWLLILSQLVK